MRETIRFRQWFWAGSGGAPGKARVFRSTLLLYLIAATPVAYFSPISASEAAGVVGIPLVGILIGLTFGWAGASQGLLRSRYIRRLARNKDGGLADYVYAYQLAVLEVMVILLFWGALALGICGSHLWLNLVAKSFGLGATVFVLVECWKVVEASQMLILAEDEIESKTSSESEN